VHAPLYRSAISSAGASGFPWVSTTVSSAGPTSASWMEWYFPTSAPVDNRTGSVKGMMHCTRSSCRQSSRFRLFASQIAPCVPSTTPRLAIPLQLTLQRRVAWDLPGTMQSRTTWTPPTKGLPNLSTQTSSFPAITTTDFWKSMWHWCFSRNGIPRMASSFSWLTMNVS